MESTNLPVSPLVAIPEIDSYNFKVYPNPDLDKVNVISNDDPISQSEAYFMQRRKLAFRYANSKHIELDVSTFQSGLYMIVIHSGKNNVQSARVYVAR